MAEPGTGTDPLRDRIIDAALALAEEDAGGGWYDLRLHLLAQRLGVPLGAVLERFRDADAIAPTRGSPGRCAPWCRSPGRASMPCRRARACTPR